MNIKYLKETYIAQKAKLEKIMLSGNDLTDAETKEASDLAAELKGIQAKLELAKDHAEMKGWSASNFQHSAAKHGEAEIELDEDGAAIGGSYKGLDADKVRLACTKEYRQAFNEYMRVGRERMHPDAYKTLVEGQDSSGGFFVPEVLQNKLVTKLQGLTPLSDKVTRMSTGRDSLTLPRNVYTTDNYFTSPVRLVTSGETPATATTALASDPVAGLARIDVFTQTAYLNVSRDLLDDATFDMNDYVAGLFAVAQAQQLEGWIISGTGVGQPFGILASPGVSIGNDPQPGYVAIGLGSNTTINFAGLNNLYYSVPEQYSLENACWVFNRTNTGRGIAAITDTGGRPLFGYGYMDSGMAGERPKELMGAPYYFSNQMPNAFSSNGASGVANVYPVIFGDLTGYCLVERSALSIQVLDQTAATQNQVQIVARYRVGGKVLQPWKLFVGKMSSS